MSEQGEFEFDGSAGGDGYARWVAVKTLAAIEIARRLDLPLGHEVEVWLTGGIRLRGKLQLEKEMLLVEEDRVRHLGLRVGRATFSLQEMDSCVRLD